MENPRVTIAATLALAIYAIPGFSLAYPVPTHEGLTQTLVQQYEKLRGDVFTSEQEAAIVRGSNKEDDSFRYKYHFYDPINSKGLWSRLRSSKEWVNDQAAQGGSLNSWQTYFARPDDYTWDRAVFDYAYDDKIRAAESLGHVLHLIEDASVPAHVRDDAHGNLLGVGDPDTYEKYSGIFTKGDVIIAGRVVPKTFSTVAEAFDVTARFTNESFVSDDTLFKDYTSPAENSVVIRNGFGYHSTLNYKIARAIQKYDRNKQSFVISWEFDDPQHSVSSDYWNVLSRHVVESGIGIIDLFFREVEKEKQTGVLKEKDLSPLKQHNKKLSSGFSLVKAIYGSSLNQSDVEELLADNAGQAGAAALAVANEPSAPQQDAPPAKPAVPKVSQTNPLQPQAALRVPDSSILPVDEPTESESPEQNLTPPTSAAAEPETSAPSPSTANASGASGGSPTPAPTPATGTPTGGGSTPAATPDPLSISILSPSENELFGTTTVTFTGTTSAAAIVTAAYDSTLATTTTDGSGNWTFSLSLASGTTTVSFSAATSTETTATSTRTVAVDIASPDAPTIAIDECGASFVAGDCTVAATTVTVSWDAVSSATYYDVVKNSVILATTTATSATSDVPASATTTFSVVAHKSNGTAATSTEKTVYVTTQPLIINEVAWAGTNTFPEDEWIEVKNITSSTLDLSHFVITTPDGSRTIQLSGTLSVATESSTGSGFLVIERSAEAVSGVPNVLTSDFTQLADTGEQLLLQWGDGLATTTVDSTPAVPTCGGWCAGASEGSIGYSVQQGTSTMNLTMERKDGATDGQLAASWQTTDAYSFYGTDRSPSAIFGTPGVANSNGYPAVGWFCNPDTVSIESGAHYTPPSSSCTYLLRAIGSNGNKYTAVYRGDVGSSTRVAQDFAGVAYIRQNRTTTISDPQIGEHYFVAIFEIRTGPNFDPPSDDYTPFDTYFRTGEGAPPHSNYFVIPWVYGP